MKKADLIKFLEPFTDETEIEFIPKYKNENGTGVIKNDMPFPFDSVVETQKHIHNVRSLMFKGILILFQRGLDHDQSKLESPEKKIFDKWTPRLKGTTYGSLEYQNMLKELKPALDHHYLVNSHHPEHYAKGINGMNLFDLFEMFFDWMAAVERHDDGDIYKSLEINKKRFNMSEQLYDILFNTAYILNP